MHVSSGDVANRRKFPRTDNYEDNLLKKFPDDIICNILSCLPTKDAAKTSVLSKNWEGRWKYVHNINISDNVCKLTGEDRKGAFMRFMYQNVIPLSKESGIRCFVLEIYMRYYKYHLSNWVYDVLTSNLTTLTVVELCINGTLENLPFLDKSFSQLKKLCISAACAENKGNEGLKIINHQSSSTELVLNFPVLEFLELSDCKWLNVTSVEIRAPELIKFDSHCHLRDGGFNDYPIKIYASKLEVFQSSGLSHFTKDQFDLSTPSVYYASLIQSFSTDYIELKGLQANMILRAFICLRCLELSNDIVTGLVLVKARVALPTFDQLKELQLCSSFHFNEVLELLGAMPCVQTLSLNLTHFDKCDFDQVEILPPCLVSHLRKVRLQNFQVKKSGHVDLAKFILKNSEKLQELIFYVYGSTPDFDNTHTKSWLEFPKASSSVSIRVMPY